MKGSSSGPQQCLQKHPNPTKVQPLLVFDPVYTSCTPFECANHIFASVLYVEDICVGDSILIKEGGKEKGQPHVNHDIANEKWDARRETGYPSARSPSLGPSRALFARLQRQVASLDQEVRKDVLATLSRFCFCRSPDPPANLSFPNPPPSRQTSTTSTAITMKTFFVLAATAFAAVNAATCDVSKLVPLANDADAKQCTTDSGYSFIPPTKPTEDIFPKVCASTACQAVLKTVAGLGLGDCTVGTLALETDLINPFKAGCASLAGGAGSGSSTDGATVGSSTGSTDVEVPATSEPVAAGSEASTSSGSTGASSTVTTAPTPAPSGASTVAVATGAVVLAVAGAFM